MIIICQLWHIIIIIMPLWSYLWSGSPGPRSSRIICKLRVFPNSVAASGRPPRCASRRAARRHVAPGHRWWLGDAPGGSEDWLGQIRGKRWKYAEKSIVLVYSITNSLENRDVSPRNEGGLSNAKQTSAKIMGCSLCSLATKESVPCKIVVCWRWKHPFQVIWWHTTMTTPGFLQP